MYIYRKTKPLDCNNEFSLLKMLFKYLKTTKQTNHLPRRGFLDFSYKLW